MRKYALLFSVLALNLAAHAEWFQVQSVTSYNQIVAARPNTPANTINIRIRNLENIEDIQMDRSKVLLSGQSAMDLAKDALTGQLVWIADLQESSGTYVGSVYLSYEQMIRSYAKQRMVGGQTIPPDIKSKVTDIYQRMFRDLNTTKPYENEETHIEAYKRAVQGGSYFSYDSYYSIEYLKGIFVYEALSWFKDEGQFLPMDVQKMYIDWLAQYQNSSDTRARMFEMKIRDMTVRYKLYKDFLLEN